MNRNVYSKKDCYHYKNIHELQQQLNYFHFHQQRQQQHHQQQQQQAIYDMLGAGSSKPQDTAEERAKNIFNRCIEIRRRQKDNRNITRIVNVGPVTVHCEATICGV